MKKLKVLVACEESQRVCSEMRKLGHEAYSCDIQEPSGRHPEWHILGDVLEVLSPGFYKDYAGFVEKGIQFQTMDDNLHIVKKWDLIIAHPPCTYLSNAGAARLFPKKGQLNEERYQQGLKAKEFFMYFLSADCEHIAVENPIPTRIFGLPKYTQIIQPYEYGHPYSKKTCLWLKKLPKLEPTNIVEPICSWVSGGSKDNHGNKRSNCGMKFRDSKTKSKTFEGIAKAMAEQWSKYLCEIPENT